MIVAFVQNRVTSTLYIGLAQAAYRKQVLRILSQNPLYAAVQVPPLPPPPTPHPPGCLPHHANQTEKHINLVFSLISDLG